MARRGLKAKVRAVWLLCTAVLGFLALPMAACAAEEPSRVRVGFLLTSIHGIDLADGSFSVQAFAWFVDPQGTFEVTEELQVLARQATVEKVIDRRLEDGSRYTAVRIEATIDQRYDPRSFPFDRHTLRLLLETEATRARLQLVPDADDTRLADFAAFSGWRVDAVRFETRDITYETRFGHHAKPPTFSRLALLIDIERERSVLVIEKFIGFTVALLIASLIYLVPADQLGIRVGMVTSAIFATVGNRYSLDSIVGIESAFGLVDQLSVIVFGAIYAALAVSLLAHHLHRARGPSFAGTVDRWIGLAVTASFLGLAALAFLNAHQ